MKQVVREEEPTRENEVEGWKDWGGAVMLRDVGRGLEVMVRVLEFDATEKVLVRVVA